MDPNWFYSSLAQSAAAIVGLLGAILVSRLLDQLTQVRASKQQLVEDFVEHRQKIGEHLSSVEAYAHMIRERVDQLKAATKVGTREIDFHSSGHFGNLTLGFGKAKVEDLPEDEKLLEFCREIPQIVGPVFTWDKLQATEIVSCTFRLRQLESTLPRRDTVEIISSIVVPLRAMVKQIEIHGSSLLPRSTYFLLSVLGWFSIVGVVIPLRFASGGPYKDLLSGAFILGLIALFTYFVILILEIRGAGSLKLPERYSWRNSLHR